ncbi:winged helix-turn-helix domain-containing protein [Candidatus Roizmanbacteria bacterium]|nr:winged helix-turn-helix domain-containing protein [Candidatus Roizmanbacteria bacterium]
MKEFKKAAYKVLTEADKPLHSKEITKRALKVGYLQSAGKTPEATMDALLTVDINEKKTKSLFIKTAPSTFGLRTLKIRVSDSVKTIDEAIAEKKYPVSSSVSSRQKGDIGEARIAELITLYGPNLSCYKPLTDDEGVDILVKPRNEFKNFHLQVKTRYGTPSNTSLIAHIKVKSVKADKAMGLVFAFFDTEDGDIWDYLWFVPARAFVKLARKSNNPKLGPIYKFIAGRGRKKTNKWENFLIDKRDLGNKIFEEMKKI